MTPGPRGFAVIAAVLAFLGTFGAPKPALAANAIVTQNYTSNRVWITIYDLGKTRHLDYGWMEPHSIRLWTSGHYMPPGVYYVRGEVKDPNDKRSDPRTIFDTTIQVAYGPNCKDGNEEVVLQKNSTGYHWEWRHCTR